MRLTILGGGGFRVPLIFRALRDDPTLGVDEVVLHDTDPARVRSILPVLDELAAERPGAPVYRVEHQLAGAVRDADFVFSAIRVAGLTGRICDERSALAEGVIGQETTGAGGVCYGLRTVPAALGIADAVAEHAPRAWIINFTNPAGLVTEAMRGRIGDRVVGICDSPVGLMRRVARALDVDPSRADFGYAGLNHLGWLRSVTVDGVDRLPDLLADPELLVRIEEGRLFGPEWLSTLGAVPNEYLWYWYFRSDALAAELAADQTRGEQIRSQQERFYADGGRHASFSAWERTRLEREATYMADGRGSSGQERDPYDLDGGGYDRMALAVMRAISTGEPASLVLNVANRGSLPYLDDDAVVEVPCRVDGSGCRPQQPASLDAGQQALVMSMKAVDRAVIEAARTGSYADAVKALTLHPLVGSVPVARAVLRRELDALPELRAVLVRP